MNLRRLQHMVTLVEEGSFADAARRIHISQPALTRSIQALEKELELALFDRLPRGVALTKAGRMVYQRVRRVLFEADALDRDIKLFKADDLGEVSFGFGPYPAALLLPEVMAELSRSAPALTIRAETGNATDLLAQLHAERLDFFVAERRALTPSPDVIMERLEPYRCGWFARPAHPIFRLKRITAAAIREAGLAFVPLADYGREKLRRALRYGPAESLEVQIECNDFWALRQLATRSDAIIFAPLEAITAELETGSLRPIPVQDASGLHMEMAIIRLARRTVAPAARRAIETIVACDKRLRQPDVEESTGI